MLARIQFKYATIKEEDSSSYLYSEDEKQQYTFCEICLSCPCDWTGYFLDEDLQLLGKAEDLDETPEYDHKKVRFWCYQQCIYYKYGNVRKNKRIKIPSCVKDKIRENFPDPDNKYVGFKETRDEDN